MNNNGSTHEENGRVKWIEIRDSRNRLIFKYDPAHNVIEIKPRESDVYLLIKLDEIRLRNGYTPDDLRMVFVQEYVAVDHTVQASKVPFSD